MIDLNDDEKLIIKACKNHFKNYNFDGYKLAELIFQHIIYRNKDRVNPVNMIKYLRKILLKVSSKTIEQWEERTMQFVDKSHNQFSFFSTKKPFIEELLYLHFSEIQNLQVFDSETNTQFFNLDVPKELQLKVEVL